MKFKILVVLFITSFAVKGQEKWSEYKKYNYKIAYPQSWTFSDAKSTGSAFVILSPVEKNENFRENINLNVSLLKGDNITLEAYISLSLEKIKNMLPNVEILKNETINTSSGNHQIIIWTGSVGGMSLKVKQHLYVKEKQAYVLSFSATKDSYNRFEKTANRILNSFTID